MIKYLFIICFTLNISFFSLFSKTLDASTITIYPEESYQEMDGFGANVYTFPIGNDLGWEWDKVKYVFDEVEIHYVRFIPWFLFWEPEKIEVSYDKTDWTQLDSSYEFAKSRDLKMAQILQERGIKIDLGLGWDFPSWLANGEPKTINPSLYPDFGKMVALYILFLKNQGISIETTEIQNEPDIEATILYKSPQDLGEAGLSLIDELNQAGLSDVNLYGPDLHSPVGTADWGAILLKNEVLKKRMAAISYHTWWVDSKEEFEKIKNFAEAEGKPVWATETGFCALPSGCDNNHFFRPETWGTAWDDALSFYRAIDWSHASRLYVWTLLGNDAVISRTGERFPTFYILQQFAHYIAPGDRLVKSLAEDEELKSLVFHRNQNEFSIILLNTSANENQVDLSLAGLEIASLSDLKISTENNYMKEELSTSSEQKGIWSLKLPPQSVTGFKITVQNKTKKALPGNHHKKIQDKKVMAADIR